MFVCCKGCVLSGRGLCDGLITRPELRRCVLSRNLVNDGDLAHWGLSRPIQTNKPDFRASHLTRPKFSVSYFLSVVFCYPLNTTV
jgi:hypothetical protein